MKNKDFLSDMKTFEFLPLDDLRVQFLSKKATKKEVWSLLKGLACLPEYRSQSTFFTTSSVKTVWV